MTVNNPDTGAGHRARPAMYIEANIHGNEIQGGEVCLYTDLVPDGELRPHRRRSPAWSTSASSTSSRRSIPTAAQYFMEGPGGNARSGHVPVDDDNDGLFDEDRPGGPQRQRRHRADPQARARARATTGSAGPTRDILEPVPFGETGDYILLGQEGVDNDGDGLVNEDGPGGYDRNRN
ncbi:MAG: hypothetical protein MZW92_10165 [Comamonadaceae bacterium]|nr:hypothetical protein [Comamonadaceae bacterium]